MIDPIVKVEDIDKCKVWGGKPSVSQEEIESFLADLATVVTFTVETTVIGNYDGISHSQSTHIAPGVEEVYARHPKIRISLRRAAMVLGKRHLNWYRGEYHRKHPY